MLSRWNFGLTGIALARAIAIPGARAVAIVAPNGFESAASITNDASMRYQQVYNGEEREEIARVSIAPTRSRRSD